MLSLSWWCLFDQPWDEFFFLNWCHVHVDAIFYRGTKGWNEPLLWILHRKPLARFCTNFAYNTVLLFPDSCPICLDILENPRTLKCKHVFCTKCLKKALAVNYKCPVCYEPQGVVQGNQPPGEMKTRFDSSQAVPGYEGIFMLYLSKLPFCSLYINVSLHQT